MELTQIKLEIPAEDAVQSDELLLELGIAGWSVLEDAIAKRAWIVGIFEGETEARTRKEELEPLLTSAAVRTLGAAEERRLGDRDWRDSYKIHFKAWQFGRLHWVPIWEKTTFTLPPDEAVLWLDPGLAFGTGNHETTRLCVERLVERANQTGASGRVIDAGCGSGILALSAVLLGWGNIVGFDNDSEAVRVSEENAALNGLRGRVDFFCADLERGLAGRQTDVLLANIQADILMRFTPELVRAIAPGGVLILSGILAVERDTVKSVFVLAAPGWTVDSRIMGEWSDVMLVRPV